ncbi:DUF6528 family protein [Glycomyces sp. YM15]|uniref:DUF6528 family protein n=1 Tax=Glycomyces sp. YM15 TaxID=2800446 RepID=UPI001965F38B|nr:DUF6528 family protein [Glycomyces sp. YM15]
MDRRALLRGAGLLLPAAAAAGFAAAPAAAQEAQAANYKVIVAEQKKNYAMVFPKNKAFTDANAEKIYKAANPYWADLSDVRIRSTASHGTVGLLAASGGAVGIWDVKSKKVHSSTDLLWEARPGGNPHAFERIPNIGAYVSASSDGFLTLWAPSDVSKPGTLARVQELDLPGAHGVLWDPGLKWLWACGNKIVKAYKVTGSKRSTRLSYTGKSVTLSGLGHDLQPDYSNSGRMLVTDTHGVYSFNKGTQTKTRLHDTTRVKSYVKHSSGEHFYVRGKGGSGSHNWASETVVFSQSTNRTRSGAWFYKARLYSTAYN